MYILGISAFYHDSAAAIIKDGVIIAAAEEERFSRLKHDARFPTRSIEYCLRECGIELSDIAFVTFYEKPFVKFERILETYLSYAPRGFASYIKAMPTWLKEKLFLKKIIKNELEKISNKESHKKIKLNFEILFSAHHLSHAASAFYPSPFQSAAVLVLDGVGEWSTTTVYKTNQNKLELLWEIDFPHSVGLLYSAFTYYCGFKVNSGEYKLMGLAPYGEPKYVELIYKHLIDLKKDGTFRLNMDYFEFPYGLKMINQRFENLFGGKARIPESEITQKEMDLAKSIQVVTEEIVLRLARTIRHETGEENLCLAGGVALNCVANGKLVKENIFKNIWIQPAAGDSGGAIGAALLTWHSFLNHPLLIKNHSDQMQGSFLGPSFKTENMIEDFNKKKAKFNIIEDEKILLEKVATLINDGKVIGWFQGRMEFGPRALGNRSILADARNRDMQKLVNLKIKKRESFRPFAPAVPIDDLEEYFELTEKSPYMLIVANIQSKLRLKNNEIENALGLEKLKAERSKLPAITHVDFSARVQTVHPETNERFYLLLKEFKKQTGTSVILNTSFNLRGEPVVCTPDDAYECFMQTEIDFLVINNLIFDKTLQPRLDQSNHVNRNYELD